LKSPRSLRLALLLAATALSGCAATAEAVRTNDQASLATDRAFATVPKADPTAGNPVVAHVDTMYFGQTLYRRRRGDDFPPGKDRVLIRSPGEVDLHGFAALVTKASGIPVALNIAKATGLAAGQTTTPGALAPASPMGINLPPLAPFPGPATASPATMATQAIASRTPTMTVLWDGPLAALLDLGAARYGVDWEYRDGVIQISDERTETFVIHALPTTSTLDSQLTTTAGQSGGGSSASGAPGASAGTSTNGAATLGASQKASLDAWGEIKTALGVIVGDRGRFAVTPSNGTVTVTASPAVLTQVSTFVREQNAILTRQVFVRVRVYAVEGSDSDDAALSFSALFQSAAKTYGLSFISPGSAPTSAVGTFTGTIIDPNSQFNGSKMVAQALSATNKTTLITELNLSALNNRPVSQQSVRSTSYIAQTAVTNGQYTSTTQLIPASLTTGFTVSLLPRIISGDRILMDYSINLSSLVALVNQTSGGQTIQLPTTDSDQGMQETELRSGQVLMLNGYIADSAADSRQGTGTPANFLLGGARSASTGKKRIIVTMEPVITSGGDS
jgi:type IVB pilus formation R64 PilN family outer membrane protein